MIIDYILSMDTPELEALAKKIHAGEATTLEQIVFFDAFDKLIKDAETLINKTKT